MNLVLGQKLKLKLEQPTIMCSGRRRVDVHFRGKVVWLDIMNDFCEVEFTSYGVKTKAIFDTKNNRCITPMFEDLKIKQ